MNQKINLRKLRKRNRPIDIIEIKAPKFDKQEYARFIKEWKEATKYSSPLRTIILNSDVIEYKGCIRKTPRYLSMHRAVRKMIKKILIEIQREESAVVNNHVDLYGQAYIKVTEKGREVLNPLLVQLIIKKN